MLLPQHIIATQILAQLEHGSPAWKDMACLPAAEASSAPKTPAQSDVPNAEAPGDTSAQVLIPARGSGNSSTTPAAHVFGLSYTAAPALPAMLFMPECTSSSGSSLTASHSTSINASFLPFGVFGAGGVFRTNAIPHTLTPAPGTSNLAQGSSSPLASAAVDVDAVGVELGASQVQVQPLAASSGSQKNNHMRPRAERSRLSNSSTPTSLMAANPQHGFLLPGAVKADVGGFASGWRSLEVQPQLFSASGGVTQDSPASSVAAPVEYGSSLPATRDAVVVGGWGLDVGASLGQLQKATASNNTQGSNSTVGHHSATANAATNVCAVGPDPRSSAAQLQSIAAVTGMTSSMHCMLNMGHGLWSPLHEAANGVSVVEFDSWTSPAQLPEAPNKTQSSTNRRSNAAIAKGSSKAAMLRSKPAKDHNSRQQQQLVMRKRKAWGNSMDSYLLSGSAAASVAAAEVGKQQRPAKVHCGSERSWLPAVQQQQQLPLEMQSLPCQAHIQQVQGSVASPMSWNTSLAGGPGTQPLSRMDSEALIHDYRTLAASATDAYLLQPTDWLAGVCIDSHDSIVSASGSVPQTLNSPQLSVCSTDTAVGGWSPEVDMEEAASEEAVFAHQDNVTEDQPAQTAWQQCDMITEVAAAAAAATQMAAVHQALEAHQLEMPIAMAPVQEPVSTDDLVLFLDELLEQTSEHFAGQRARLAAPDAVNPATNVQGQYPWQQQQQQGAANASAADFAAQAAADDMFGSLTDEDLAAAIHGLPADQTITAAAAAESATASQGTQLWWQQGISKTTAGGFAVQDAAGRVFEYPAEEPMAFVHELCADPWALERQHLRQRQPTAVQHDEYPVVIGEDLLYTSEGEQVMALASLVAVDCFVEDSLDSLMKEV